MGVQTVEDLLYHAPHRYLDATSVTPIGRVSVNQEVTLVGRVVSKAVVPTRKRLRVFRAVIEDSSGVIECAWPGQAYLDRVIKQGQLLLVSGPVKHFHGRQVTPREQVVLAEAGDDDTDEDMSLGLVLPVYPATEGLSHRLIRKIVASHLDVLVGCVEDTLPQEVRSGSRLQTLNDAFISIHRPSSVNDVEKGRRRLAFDELFDLQLVVTRARYLAKSAVTGKQFEIKKELTTALKEALPYELTAGQKRSIREITEDMTSTERMHRLLMGERTATKRCSWRPLSCLPSSTTPLSQDCSGRSRLYLSCCSDVSR
jgi:ATP-dependent DNA helicase RecG